MNIAQKITDGLYDDEPPISDHGTPSSAPIIHDDPVSVEDFHAYMPMHQYIFAPTGDLWPAASVNARLPLIGMIKPTGWLDECRAVD
jgi:hypothetical protein